MENEKHFPGYGNIVKPPSDKYIPGRASATGRVGNRLSDEGVDDIHFMMINMGHAEMSRMRESVFVEVFLPVLSGKVKDDELFVSFIKGCGGMGRWAEIIDDTGRVIFRVPPIVDTTHLDVGSQKGNDQPSFASIVSMAQMLHHISPVQATNHFDNAVYSRVLSTHTSKNVLRYEKEWREIFERYGIKRIDNDNANGSQPAEVSATSGAPANQIGGIELDSGNDIW